MAYINKSYLKTQFDNFATRISTIFAKKTESGYSIYIDKDNKIILKNKDGEVLSTQQLPMIWK